MLISEIELYEALSQQMGAEKAKALVHYVESKVDRRLEEKTNIFATKEDLANVKAEIIKWMFIFWIGQLASFIGIAKFIFHQ
jgi:hypothetical protein